MKSLIALTIFMIFAATIGTTIFVSIHLNNSTKQLTDSIYVVVSTFGGLTSPVIGYYFGDSAFNKCLFGYLFIIIFKLFGALI